MAVRQLNTSDYDYAMFLETLNKSYKGKADITISEYDSDAAPDVKAGSVWEDNGAIFILESADLTPTGYGGISNSVTFYLYFDESASVFIYLETVPTWNDALQGWYNANDRAFFSMFKDSGGTLYQNKWVIGGERELFNRKLITSNNFIHATAETENNVFDKVAPFIPNTGDIMLVNGGITGITISRAVRTSSSIITFYGILPGTFNLSTKTVTDGAGATTNYSLGW